MITDLGQRIHDERATLRPKASKPLLQLLKHLTLDVRMARVVIRVMERLEDLVNHAVGVLGVIRPGL